MTFADNLDYIRSLAESEHADKDGNVWLLWNDRAVRLSEYYRWADTPYICRSENPNNV